MAPIEIDFGRVVRCPDGKDIFVHDDIEKHATDSHIVHAGQKAKIKDGFWIDNGRVSTRLVISCDQSDDGGLVRASIKHGWLMDKVLYEERLRVEAESAAEKIIELSNGAKVGFRVKHVRK